MPRELCPICGKLMVLPVGPPDSYILLVGEYPGWEELKSGYVWVGKGGDVLRAELAMVGIQYEACRVTNLWGHHPSKEESEYDWHMGRLLGETKGRKYILLMGSDVCKAFLDEAVSDVSGLIVTSPYLPPDAVAVACKNPAVVLHDGATIGDVRHAMSVFGRVVND